jgi:tripartite-type tricarboxylate transporter receptor subunit TctC
MPADLVAKLQSHVVKVLAQPEVKQRLGVLGFEAIGTSPAEFARFIGNEMATYSNIIRDANIKAE